MDAGGAPHVLAVISFSPSASFISFGFAFIHYLSSLLSPSHTTHPFIFLVAWMQCDVVVGAARAHSLWSTAYRRGGARSSVHTRCIDDPPQSSRYILSFSSLLVLTYICSSIQGASMTPLHLAAYTTPRFNPCTR